MGNPAKKETVFSGFRKKIPVNGSFLDCVAIQWDAMSVTVCSSEQRKEK